MENSRIINDLQTATFQIYKENGLASISGMDSKYILNGRSIFEWHLSATRKSMIKHGTTFNYFQNLDDILFCSDELLYFTGQLYLYRPFINNPLRDSYYAGDKNVYPNIQNLAAKRYSMFSDVVGQSAYNYWDRIGDLIASFFPKIIKPERVFFVSAIEAVPSEFHTSINYAWLDDFKNNGYKELNKMRKDIVHYKTSDTTYKHQHLASSNNRELIAELHAEREALPDYYKKHLALTIEGFEKTLSLLEEIDSQINADVV